eukprot:TRINITY_DN10609_c0_g2_i3.p1 TRINITY_DN10609_c0_g2~~TRINITY_DN10609_c0_g2_i3.p1  ORF type:complete len:255 (-),score=48.04 TRINITY_DN10609_c0_g2_i3:2-766(-)
MAVSVPMLASSPMLRSGGFCWLALAVMVPSVLGLANPNSLTLHPLPDPAPLCMGGVPAGLYAWTGGDPTKWVIQLGSESPGLDMCISPAHCELVATRLTASNRTAFLPMHDGLQANISLGLGILSQDCTENPDFCGFNQAQLMMCDYALLMSNSTVTGPNGTQLHFRGLDILEASLEKLSTMGLNKATHVLLTGFGHGGTSVFMPVSYTHLRAHETPEHLVCRLLLEKKKKKNILSTHILNSYNNKNYSYQRWS